MFRVSFHIFKILQANKNTERIKKNVSKEVRERLANNEELVTEGRFM